MSIVHFTYESLMTLQPSQESAGLEHKIADANSNDTSTAGTVADVLEHADHILAGVKPGLSPDVLTSDLFHQ